MTPVICGGTKLYCPEGSKLPREVSTGYHTVGAVDNDGVYYPALISPRFISFIEFFNPFLSSISFLFFSLLLPTMHVHDVL